MKCFEFGRENKELVVVLHGGGVSYQGAEPTVKIKSKIGKDVYCFFFTGLFYVIMGNPGPLRTKFLCKVTGRTMEEANRLLYRNATWKSWKNQDYCLIGKKTDYSLFKKQICTFGMALRERSIKNYLHNSRN